MAADDRPWGNQARMNSAMWRNNDRVAVLSPLPGVPRPDVELIRTETNRLQGAGVVRILTGALHEWELQPFVDAGFVEHERLHLLSHDLRNIVRPTQRVRHRRAWRRDLPDVLRIDAAAFDSFWALDESGLNDAMRATPTHRFRVTTASDQKVTGYAVAGRAGRRGYLQRLAVDPDRTRQGIGTALVADCLRWLGRSGVRAAVVNTQEGNEAALALYLATGFELQTRGLTVLALDMDEL